MATITLELDVDTAKAYAAAPAEEQKKMRLLLSLWLRELALTPAISLSQLMDNISDKARTRGLTSEILESLFNAD